jgi:3-oxoacyl-[acyl-carrier-protein] synthase-3
VQSFGIAGSGVYVPRTRIRSDQLDERAGRAPGDTEERMAIRARAFADEDETSSLMAAEAAGVALTEAGWQASDIDVLIAGCSVMEQPIPGTAVMVQRRLGLGKSGIPAFDVNATCLSGFLALDMVWMGLALGRWRRALIVTADVASAALDFSDPEASLIFGDGAAALAVSAEGGHRLRARRFESFGDHADLCRLEAGGTRLSPHCDLDSFLAASHFRMDGPALFRATARHFPGFLDRLLADANLDRAEIDLVVPHQASAPALQHLQAVLGCGPERMIDIFAEHGNQVATSLFHAFHVAITDARLKQGMKVLLVGSSAGISLAGAVIEW